MNLRKLQRIRERVQRHLAGRTGGRRKYHVVFSMGTAAIAAGARDVMTTVLHELEKRGIEHVSVSASGEAGLMNEEPVVRVESRHGETVTYAKVTPAVARRIVIEHLDHNRVVVGRAVGRAKPTSERNRPHGHQRSPGPPKRHLRTPH